MKTFLIPTSQSYHLAKNILSKVRDIKVVFPSTNKEERRRFPDGEIYMALSSAKFSLKGKGGKESRKIVVLHSGVPKPNEGLIELELILQILKDNNIEPEVFFSYFPYGMQDRVFRKGETNVAENLIEKLIDYYRVKKIYIIDPHFGGRKWVKKWPIVNISAVPLLIKRAKEDFGENILFLSPDKGGKRRTKILGFNKKRMDSFNVKMFSPKIKLKNKTVAAVDDLIKTGGTLLKFYEIAKKSGAKEVIALITHGVIPEGISKIKKKYSKLYLANTINRKEANIDITELILKNLL